jgi:ATP-dependent helicase/nuclease subunit B
MELQIIYGTAGTGKSTYCFRKSAENCKENKNTVIITPEQFSFTAEKRLMESIYEKTGSKAVLNAEVITFNRMAYRVLNEVLGTANNKKNLSKCGKAMLMYSILDKQKNNLKFLGKTSENIDISLTAINEFKQHGITAFELQEEIEKTEDKYLKTKLEDMNIIYRSFENQIKDKYIDETDLLTMLANNIGKTEMFKNTIFYIDEFSGFTKQEYDIIKKLIKIADEVNITICSDSLFNSNNPETDIYYSNKQTITKLFKIADELDIQPKEVLLDENYRFKTPELKFLQENLYLKYGKKAKIKSTSYNEKVENIELFLAQNQYSEIENVAKNITKLVRDKNYKYKEISVITKNIDTYSNLVRAIFSEYNIPVFIDEKRELNQNIVIQYVLAILEVLSKNWSYESVFNYIKTGFLSLEEDEIFKLENYCLKWGIRQNKWKKEFNVNIDENQKEEIERLNEIRRQIVEPLLNLKEKIDREKTGEGITKNLYKFLIEQNIEAQLEDKIQKLENESLIDLVNEYVNSYKILIDIFDEINLVFQKDKISLEKYIQILKVGLKNSGLGKIPGTQDQVTLGDVNRSRSHKARAVFILGINDGVFPSVNKNEGFLNDKDREILKEHGVELAKGTLERLYEDNFNIYKAFTTAEEKLYLSYISADSEGRAQRPASLISKIKKMFPKLQEESDVVSERDEISTCKTTYGELIKNINKLRDGNEIDEKWYEVYKYYKENPEFKEKLKINLEGLKYTNLPQNINKENIQKLYGNTLTTSISKLETYKRCAFSYYLKYGLKLNPKEELKIQSINTGTFMHEVIDEFFETIKEQRLELAEFIYENEESEITPEEKLKQIIDKIIEEKLKQNKNYVFISSQKYKLLVERLKRIILKALKYIIETLVQSEFSVLGSEIEFARDGKYKPIMLNLENGKRLEIIGKIDRMDIGKNEEGKYLRIIDYKSSAKDIDLNEVYAGLQIQLLTYMDAICKEEDLMPAGILYFSLLEQTIKAEKKLSLEEIENKIKENFKMKGLILADIKVVKMHDKNLSQGQSKLVPAYIDKSGNLSPKRTKGISKEQFEILQEYIYKTIKEIGAEILEGNIELKPYNKNGNTPCKYCEYKQICNFNPSLYKNEYNYIPKKDKDQVLEDMKSKID